MQDLDPRTAGRAGARAVRWTARLLVLIGIGTLGWCGLVVADAYLSQQLARRSLDAVLSAAVPPPPRVPGAAASPSRSDPAPRTGDAVAAISIPRLNLSEVVLHGSDARTLRRGPGHLESTPLPGEAGNVVIAGHRDTFFSPLRRIEIGDDIFMDTRAGRFHYRVTALDVVGPHDGRVLAPTRDATLTLITCYPFWVLGPAPDRFVVRATRIVAPAADVSAIAPEPMGGSASIAAPPETSSRPSIARARPVTDTSLIRDSIERFRLTYNARLASHNDTRPSGPLRFSTCEIRIADVMANATCRNAAQESEDGSPHDWTLTLWRSGEGWAIKTIEAN